MKKIILIMLLSVVSNMNYAQQTPAPKQVKDYTITGGTIHIGNGEVVKDGMIVFSKGKLTYVGKEDVLKQKGEIIKAKGKQVYPGFIAVNTSLGLVEVDAVRASNDVDEVGAFIPHVRSLIAYNTESIIVETMRPNGVLMAQITPRGGTISGTSSVVQLDAWNWEDAVINENDAVHINWISSFSRNGSLVNGKYQHKRNKRYKEQIEKLRQFFSNAKSYLATKNEKINLPFEATKGLFFNKQKLFIHVSGEKAIQDAIDTFIALGIKNLVLVGAEGADNVSELLKKHNIPVVLERSHRLPRTEDEDIYKPYKSAKELVDLGILVGLGMNGDMERMQTRNLPFFAGTYGAYGLGKENALKLITENNAKILGISDKVGTLTVGKDATLFVSEGDALDMRTNKLSHAFIQGRKISLETHQTELFKRYSEKYKNEK